ncbi:MAG: DUF2480 family protein [Chitinophagaceae bacterium]
MENDLLVNKVAESGIVTLDLEQYLPQGEWVVFDIKPYLFMELILKEKDFRAALLTTDWQLFAGKQVTITCTADAIIPMWAYMLVANYLQPVAAGVYFGSEAEAKVQVLLQNIQQINAADYTDKRVVIKGCGDAPIPEAAYVAATALLRPVAKSIMYGEPCSTVPIYKKKP